MAKLDNNTTVDTSQDPALSGVHSPTVSQSGIVGPLVDKTYIDKRVEIINEPGGNTTEVQLNANGKFAGDNGLTFNSSTDQLNVKGNINAGGWIKGKIRTNTYNIYITGGTSGQVLTTDGTGNLSWSNVGEITYGNTNVANYLPTYTGNLSGGNIQVTNTAYLYNISSTGTTSLTTLNVGAVSNLGNVNNVKITGGTANYVLTTDGTGNLSWSNVSTGVGNYANSNVANYLPTYTGNITAGNANVIGNVTANYFIGNGSQLTGLPASYSNTNVAAYLPTYTSNFTAGNANVTGNVTANYFIGDGSQLTNIAVESGTKILNGNSYANIESLDGDVEISANGVTWTFDTVGTITLPSGGLLVADIQDGTYLQANPGVDGYAGITSDNYNSWMWTANDGNAYISASNGYTNKTWSFNTDGGLRFPDNSVQTTAYPGSPITVADVAPGSAVEGDVWFNSQSGRSYVKYNDQWVDMSPQIVPPDPANPFDQDLNTIDNVTFNKVSTTNINSNSNIFLSANNNEWKFGDDGSLTFPSNMTIGYEGIQASANTVLGILTQGSNGAASLQWIDDFEDPTSVAAVVVNSPFANIGAVQIVTGNFDEMSPNNLEHSWTFDANGNLTFPDSTVQTTAYTGQQTSEILISDVAPSSAVDGTVWWNSEAGRSYIQYNNQWVDMSPQIVPPDPANPFDQDLNTTDNVQFNNISVANLQSNDIDSTSANIQTASINNLTVGNAVSNAINTGSLNATANITANYFIGDGSLLTNIAFPTTNNAILVSDIAPNANVEGSLWFNSIDGRTYITYNNQWVDSSPTIMDPTAIRTDENDDIQLPKNIIAADGRIYQDGINGKTSMRWVNLTDGTSMIRAYRDPFNDGNEQDQRAEIGMDYQAANTSGIYIAGYENDSQRRWTFEGDGNIRFPDNTIQTTAYQPATLLDGGGANAVYISNIAPGGINNPFDQELNTSDNVQFANVNATYFIGNGSMLTGIIGGASNYSNSNVANYLPTYTGNISATYITGANVHGKVANSTFTDTAQTAISVPVANISGLGNIATINLDTSSSNVLYGNGVWSPISSYGNSNVVSLLSSFGSNSISTTGNVSANYFIGNGSTLTYITGGNVTGQVGNSLISGTVYTNAQPNITSVGTLASLSVTGLTTATGGVKVGNIQDTSGTNTIQLSSGSISVTGNITAGAGGTGNVSANYFIGNGSQLTGIPSSYANSNVATFLASFGSNTISTTGNVSAGNAILTGTSVTGINSVLAGPTFTPLSNTMAGFVSNVNSYTQLTIQNKSTGADATTDFIATADNGSDTVNYLDLGIINSGYDNGTPTNSLGNIVFAADSYIYAQGNTSATGQSGGNLAIGTTVASKTVKIFAGGVTSSNIVASFANTGVSVTGNVTSSGKFVGDGSSLTNVTVNVAGNIQGTGTNVSIVAGSYTSTFDNTGTATFPGVLSATYNPASATGAGLVLTSGNTQGGTGYSDFLKVTNNSGGATNPNKTLRLNSTGTMEIINSAYSATIFSLDNGGNLTVPGTVTATNGVLAVPAWTSAGAITIGATTTAPTKPTTRVKDNISYRQVGAKQWEVIMSWLVTSATGAANGTGDFLFTLPNSLQFDTTLSSQSAYTSSVGSSTWSHTGYIIPGGTGLITNNTVGGQVFPMVYSSTQFRILAVTSGSGVQAWGSSFFVMTDYTAMQLTFRFTST